MSVKLEPPTFLNRQGEAFGALPCSYLVSQAKSFGFGPSSFSVPGRCGCWHDALTRLAANARGSPNSATQLLFHGTRPAWNQDWNATTEQPGVTGLLHRDHDNRWIRSSALLAIVIAQSSGALGRIFYLLSPAHKETLFYSLPDKPSTRLPVRTKKNKQPGRRARAWQVPATLFEDRLGSRARACWSRVWQPGEPFANGWQNWTWLCNSQLATRNSQVRARRFARD